MERMEKNLICYKSSESENNSEENFRLLKMHNGAKIVRERERATKREINRDRKL